MKETRIKTEVTPGTTGEYFYIDTNNGFWRYELWFRTGGNRRQSLVAQFHDDSQAERICRIMNKGSL